MHPPVFLPHNEPYLGRPQLLEFDQIIPPMMAINTRLAARSFEPQLSPVERAAVQLISQAVGIALSIRELVRQGYLFSGALLLRPLIERAGTAEYIRVTKGAAEAWHAGWPRRNQPQFQELLKHALRSGPTSPAEIEIFATLLHKIIHPDPTGAHWNIEHRSDGPVFSPGKMLDSPELCDHVSLFASRFLFRVMQIAEEIFSLNGDRNDKSSPAPGA